MVNIPKNIDINRTIIDLSELTNRNGKLQNFVKSTMKILLRNNLIPAKELYYLMNSKDYCTLTLGLSFPLISLIKDTGEHPRYYSEPIYASFYICNDWKNLIGEEYDRAKKQRNQMYAWLVRLAAMY